MAVSQDAAISLPALAMVRDKKSYIGETMKREVYDEYIERFNAEDPTAFDDFIAPDMHMINGALEFRGVEGMKEHYERKIWPYFKEKLNVIRFVSDENVLAVQLWTHFTARVDGNTLFGPVRTGETFDYRGLIMYDVENGKFTSITVAYNSFKYTNINGETVNLGIPH
jgi:hypothetical protein